MARREGFILAATLWALVALTVVATYINGVTRTNVDNAHRAKRMLQAELDRRSTEATVLYLLATNRMSRRSLVLENEQRFAFGPGARYAAGDGALSLGSEAYQGLGEIAFSLQDELGLVSVNTPTRPLLTRVLVSLGVPAGDAARLMPRIRDYIDVDRTLTLDGAEDFDYAKADRPPPANWFLANSMELNRVLGAEGLLDRAQRQRLRAMTTPRLLGALNFNTMPPEVAAAVLQTDPENLAAFLAARERESLTRLDRILELTGREADIDSEYVRHLALDPRAHDHLVAARRPAHGGRHHPDPLVGLRAPVRRTLAQGVPLFRARRGNRRARPGADAAPRRPAGRPGHDRRTVQRTPHQTGIARPTLTRSPASANNACDHGDGTPQGRPLRWAGVVWRYWPIMEGLSYTRSGSPS